MEPSSIDECIENSARYSKIKDKHPYCPLGAGCKRASDQAYIRVDGELKPVCRLKLELDKLYKDSN